VLRKSLLVVSILVATSVGVAIPAPPADAAGIVTHAWMAIDGISWSRELDLKVLLLVNIEQVRAGAEFPDGGYWTRGLGIPGGDYGEEAHWQRFVEAYAAEIRNDPDCGDLTDPFGPCAPEIAHLMGTAAHGLGDEVFDWLFEPSAPGHFENEYLPPEWEGIVGTGGIEAQMDMIAIEHHHRPVESTATIPNLDTIVDAFARVGRGDIAESALPIGEQFLEAERLVEATWAPDHAAGVLREMPWSASNLRNAPGGVWFAAQAIGGYYDWLWGQLLEQPVPTSVSITVPQPGQKTVPALGWTGDVGAGSHDGNTGGENRIAAVLTSALPYRALAGGGSIDPLLPPDAMRLRDVRSGVLVPARTGFPRVVPYNPEAGEHVIAFHPARDLAPCRWYQVEVTTALLDAQGHPVVPTAWRFRTSGCVDRTRRAAIRGAATCQLTGIVGARAASTSESVAWVSGVASNCRGGQDGTPLPGARLPIASATAAFGIRLPGTGCDALTHPNGPATLEGAVSWRDASGHEVAASAIRLQTVADVRGGVVEVEWWSDAFPGYAMALRLQVEPSTCAVAAGYHYATITAGAIDVWNPLWL
jgi:hypothetical protein